MGIFYKSLRVGRYGRKFNLLKFRTMYDGSHGGSPTAAADDPRLTPVGRFLRRYKLDELPTLLNLLRGDLAVVGPRPDVPSEIESLDSFTRLTVLAVRPGLISPATLWDIDEDEQLRGLSPTMAQAKYEASIKPTKYRLNVWYVNNRSAWLDLKVIVATALRLLRIPVHIKVFKVFPPGICKN